MLFLTPQESLDATGNLKSYVESGKGKRPSSQQKDLEVALDEALGALEGLRRYHLGIVTKYLVRTSTGTGTSTFRTLLKEALDDTVESRTADTPRSDSSTSTHPHED